MSELAGKRKRRMDIGSQAVVELPFSEVCMHMRVAGHFHRIELVRERDIAMVRIYDRRDCAVGAPVTTGEAGVYRDEQGFYIYEPELVAVP